MNFGLNTTQAGIVKKIFARHLSDGKVIVYGSRAKGNYTARSDIDLVIKNTLPNRKILADIMDDIDESNFPYLCDLQYFSQIKNLHLIDHIERVGKVFYEKPIWETVKLGDVCSINNGGTPNSKEKSYWGDEIEWLTPKDMGKLTSRFISKTERQITKEGLANSSAKLVPEKSVILSCRAPIGHVAINEVPMSFNQGCKGLIPNEKITTEFLYYFLILSKDLLNDLGTGTTFKEISAKTLSNVSISIPPLAEQQRIVAKLDAAFAEIDKAIEATEAKEAEIRELQAAFLSTSLNEETVTWKTVKLGDVCELAYGKALDKSDRLEGDGIPAFGANGVKTYSKKSLFNEPSIIVGRKGSAGEINKVAAPFWALDVTYYTKIKKEIITLDFLFYTLTTLNLPSMARGVKPGINRNDVYNKNILLPPIDEQKNIVTKLDATFADIEAAHIAIKKKKENCEALKSAILAQELKSEAA